MSGPYRNPAEIIPEVVRKWATENIETQAPGVIVSVDDYSAERCVAVLPLVMERQEDGDVIVPDTINKAPVILQGCSDGFVSFPLKVGDKVWLGYCKRSLEEYVFSLSTDQYMPVDTRVFGSTDVVVLGMIGQANQDKPLNPDNFEVNYKDSSITITPSNVMTMTNGTSTIVMDGTSVTINGATIPSDGNYITTSGTDLDQLKADLQAFKDLYNAHGAGATGHPPTPPA